MSGGAVTRLRFTDTSVIVKRASRPVETHVYTALSETFESHDITTPRLLWAEDAWLVIEDIPHPLPRERWDADVELLAMLRRLHSLPLDQSQMPPGAYVPAWPEGLSESALALLPGQERADLEPLLERARQDTLPLFDPACPISGDPNPLNWGLRDDGALVLYDWERFTLGTPAIDLAITVPGLGDEAAFRRVAATYLKSGAAPGEVDGLARSILLAKIWSVVEFLGGVADGTTEPTYAVDTLVEQVSPWLWRNLSP